MGTFAYYTGQVLIPEDKKQEFNENMMILLQQGGMVNLDTVNLYDKKIVLMNPIQFDKEGKSYFNYSYFEDDPWEDASFDCKSNRLWSNKIGDGEFNFVIGAAYFLTEIYSEDLGWVTENGDILNYPDYVRWINFVLDKDFNLEKRFNIWKLCERYCLGQLEDCHVEDVKIEIREVLSFVPKGYEAYVGGTEFADIFYIAVGTDDSMAYASCGSYAEEIYTLKKKLSEFYAKNPDDGKNKIWSLLMLPKDKREEFLENDCDDLAKISTRVAARAFVYLSAEILGFSFWPEWKKICKDVYQDELKISYVSDEVAKKRQEVRSASLGKIKTSEFLRNDGLFTFYNTPDEIKHKENYYVSDDDLMFWWDESGKVELSQPMIKKILEWKKEYDVILANLKDVDSENYDMLKNLMNVLKKVDDFYKRIYAFKNMFYEFIEKSKDLRYIAAIKLFEQVIEANKKDGKIIDYAENRWGLISKNVTFNEGRVTIKRFISLMANNKLRKKYFDF